MLLNTLGKIQKELDSLEESGYSKEAGLIRGIVEKLEADEINKRLSGYLQTKDIQQELAVNRRLM